MVRVTPNYIAVYSRVDTRAPLACIGICFHRVVFVFCFVFLNEEPVGQTLLGLFFGDKQPFSDLRRRARVGHRPLEEYQNDKAQSGSDVSGDMRRLVFHSYIILPEHLEIR